ncbi:MAG: hypothetical protein LC794_16485 [Acidobacteria bacterium]|nr:hypothetical protein [Acidobacteriota bacterium]
MMKLEIWIAIAGIVVQSIIAIIGIVVQFRSNQKQIQIALAQAKPTEKATPKKPVNWLKTVLFTLYLCGSIWGLASSVYIFIIHLPASPRLVFVVLAFNLWLTYYNVKNLRRISRWPWRGSPPVN